MNYWFIIHDIKEISEKNTEISAMCAIPKPHQPPHSSYFGILMFLYDEESDHSNKAVRKTPEIESGHKVSEEVKWT